MEGNWGSESLNSNVYFVCIPYILPNCTKSQFESPKETSFRRLTYIEHYLKYQGGIEVST